MRPKLFRRPTVVEVEWVDSMAYPGWGNDQERIAQMACVDDLRHRTCGYLIRQTDEYVSVALSVGWTGRIGDAIQIPQSAVTSIRVLSKTTYS